MKKLCASLVLLLLASSLAYAQQNVRIRGTISALDGDVLAVKSRDGTDLRLQLAPDLAVATAKAISLSDLKPGTFVGSAARKAADGLLVALEVHTLGPQVPAGHIENWDLEPGSSMTNANVVGVVQVSGGSEMTLQYKDGSQRILVPAGTPIVGFEPADRSALKPGEYIFTGARREADGRLVTQRIQVSKDGVRPAH